tara:strand:+ start:816 stop:989 length:174 start_codon:yes stop_codon:yes gene_type:complete
MDQKPNELEKLIDDNWAPSTKEDAQTEPTLSEWDAMWDKPEAIIDALIDSMAHPSEY